MWRRKMNDLVVKSQDIDVPDSILLSIDEFLSELEPFEYFSGQPLRIYFDRKSAAHYLVCHLCAEKLAKYADLEATLDGTDEDEIYKLNRDITTEHVAYRQMEEDALTGRSFEDIVIEYDTNYQADRPLKIYGGQHRIRAIIKAAENDVNELHGVRVYFNLDKDQKVEIAMVNNTSIAVSNDLLDRMREQLLGDELRMWGQKVGLLEDGKDYSDRGSSGIPTVRMARTILVNFFRAQGMKLVDNHKPDVCKSGGVDEAYQALRKTIDWNDAALLEMGKQFARLHKAQSTTVQNRKTDRNAQYAKKTLSLAIVTSWSYAAGLFQDTPQQLSKLYSLPDSVRPPADPLNAKAMGQASLKGVDSDTYRGLGTRSNTTEYGRVLELFIIFSSRDDVDKITKKLANAAIKSYHAKETRREADAALGDL